MSYEQDEIKSGKNKAKHGLDFEEAKRLFADPDHLILPAKLMDEETRFVGIGMIVGKLWACITTERDGVIRIISCRRARKKEERIYEQAKKNC